MSAYLLIGICALSCYLVGGIPFGVLAGRLNRTDIRLHGSGNIGATNVTRQFGVLWGGVVLLLDVGKGLLSTWLSYDVLVHHPTVPITGTTLTIGRLLCGTLAVIGHTHSPYLGFRGGRGVATSMGVVLALYPDLTLPAAISVALWLLVFAISRIASLGSMVALLALPLSYAAYLPGRTGAWNVDWPYLAFCCLLTVLILTRHRENIGRLVRGSEPQVGSRR